MGSTNLIAIFVSKLMCNFVFMNFYLITNDFCCKTNYKKYQTWLHLYFEGSFRTNELFSLKISLFLQLFFQIGNYFLELLRKNEAFHISSFLSKNNRLNVTFCFREIRYAVAMFWKSYPFCPNHLRLFTQR